MKRIGNVTFAITAIITACSIVAGAHDCTEQKKKERKAKSKGRAIHKPYGLYEMYFKRAFDFFLSSMAFALLIPFLFITAVMVRIAFGAPVLFVQQRPGRDNKVFRIYKFRTMTNERDCFGELLPDEVRLTDFGKLLRSYSIDELPELFNVIRGDMSLVGPRPLLVKYLPLYSDEQRQRHDVRPGLTGLAQVSGRNKISWEERLQKDISYVNSITFRTDWKILLQTVQKVIKRDGVCSKASPTMEEFQGTKTTVFS